jgi:hypothetical protein
VPRANVSAFIKCQLSNLNSDFLWFDCIARQSNFASVSKQILSFFLSISLISIHSFHSIRPILRFVSTRPMPGVSTHGDTSTVQHLGDSAEQPIAVVMFSSALSVFQTGLAARFRPGWRVARVHGA